MTESPRGRRHSHHSQAAPVGFLLLSCLDRDSIRPRMRSTEGRRMSDRSLTTTNLALHPREDGSSRKHSVDKRSETSHQGKRYFDHHDHRDIIVADTPVPTNTGRRHSSTFQESGAAGCASQLNSAVHPIRDGTPYRRHTRYLAGPPSGVEDDWITGSPSRLRVLQTSWNRDHLDVGNLIPAEEPPKPRLVPPPLPERKIRFGRRHTPPPATVHAEDRRQGIKIVRPPAHWIPLQNRQLNRFLCGLDYQEPVNLVGSYSASEAHSTISRRNSETQGSFLAAATVSHHEASSHPIGPAAYSRSDSLNRREDMFRPAAPAAAAPTFSLSSERVQQEWEQEEQRNEEPRSNGSRSSVENSDPHSSPFSRTPLFDAPSRSELPRQGVKEMERPPRRVSWSGVAPEERQFQRTPLESSRTSQDYGKYSPAFCTDDAPAPSSHVSRRSSSSSTISRSLRLLEHRNSCPTPVRFRGRSADRERRDYNIITLLPQ